MAGFFENIANKIKEQKQERLARQKEEEIHVLASISFMKNNANMSYDKVLQILNEILGQYSRLSITRFVKMHAIQQIMLDVMMKKEITAQYIEKCVANSANFVATKGNFSDKQREEALIIKAGLE